MTERSLGVGNAQVSFAVAGFFEVWPRKAGQGCVEPYPSNIPQSFIFWARLFEA
ncbi:MAG: hypothetical protein BWY01_00213 [Synergistetes bacterium ADurb.Bin155]|nr:MAG: hypothetical protein BWY01_00213 [Synergistetes bacterium ADurb.Bin155]